MQEGTKLCCANARDTKRIPVWLDRKAETRLERSKARYAALLDRQISASIVIRRGLELLDAHLEALDGDEAEARELAHLMFHVR
jgi:hypothetical protein